MDDLYDALRAADSAGDTVAATKLAHYLRAHPPSDAAVSAAKGSGGRTEAHVSPHASVAEIAMYSAVGLGSVVALVIAVRATITIWRAWNKLDRWLKAS
jgi:hypothetical protein